LFLTALSYPSSAFAESFSGWLSAFKQEAVRKGISAGTVEAALPDTLAVIPAIIRLDKKQPEKTITHSTYIKNTVSNVRVRDGRANMAEYHSLLNTIGREYGVSPAFIVALWGIETNYGHNTGNFQVIHALATLAYDARRRDFFEAELFKALQIVDDGNIGLRDMKGSWAGAMGQCQFMPSSYFRFAQDYNKDGRRDIWTTKADVFASTANYLAKSGWHKNQPWGRKVILPANFNNSLAGLETKHSIQFWHDKGVRMKDGSSIPFEGALQGSILHPNTDSRQAYLVYDNFRVIMLWNKSTYFATAVSLLADAINPDTPLE
jgi:membrane-bound lytic murein transglycosylase B